MRGMTKKATIAVVLMVIFLASICLVGKPVYAANENTWVSKSSMPSTRLPGYLVGVQTAVVDGKIYIMGCYLMDNSAGSYMYDPATDSWTPKTPLPTLTAGYGLGIAVYGNKIFVFNGSSVNVYDPSNDTWQTKPPIPVSDRWVANVINDKIYLIGESSHFEIYDAANDSWSTFSATPYHNVISTSAVSNNKIFAFADNSSNKGYAGLTEIYDPVNDSWSLGASPPQLIVGATACATTGAMSLERVYLIGGGNGLEGTNTNQVYDPQTNTWALGAEMPSIRMSPAVAVVGDIVFVLDGWANIELASNANEQYFPFGYGSPDPNYVYQQTSPSPSVPEFSSWTILLLTAVMVSASLLVYFRKCKAGNAG